VRCPELAAEVFKAKGGGKKNGLTPGFKVWLWVGAISVVGVPAYRCDGAHLAGRWLALNGWLRRSLMALICRQRDRERQMTAP